MDNGQWTIDNGQWTMDNGQFTIHKLTNKQNAPPRSLSSEARLSPFTGERGEGP